MRPCSITSGTGISAPVPVDRYQPTDGFGLTLRLLTGGGTATVEYTFDDVFNADVTPVWTSDATPAALKDAAATATAGLSGVGSISAFRINATGAAQDGWELTVSQQSTA